MSGKTELIPYFIIGIALFATATDLICGKIFNSFNVAVSISGLAFSTWAFGLIGTVQSLAGLFVGLLLFGWMFGLKMIGGGDVKYLMALGAWGGLRYSVEVAVLSILIGGAFSLAILILTRRFLDFSRRMSQFVLSILVKELEFQFPKVDSTLKMPFGVPMSIAAIVTIYLHPLRFLWG